MLVLVAQLATGAGYATTRAGVVAFLQMTELAWVYLLDVTVLGEPTSVLATLGSALVLGAAMVVAAYPRNPAAPPATSKVLT